MSRLSESQSLYDGTFALYRLSPLYYASSTSLLLPETLLLHSRRFSDSLKGDVLRGVYVGLGDRGEVSTASGALKICQWTLLDSQAEEPVSVLPGWEGIRIDAQYEKSTYTALLLRRSEPPMSREAGQMYLPLLMTRMPPALRDNLIAYIGTTFDTRIEPMRLSSQFMGDMLELYLEDVLAAVNEQYEKRTKGIQLVLGFRNAVSTDLKSLSVDIRREEVMEFIKKGRSLLKKPSSEIDSAVRRANRSGESDKQPKPFMTAMKSYIAEQTALNIEHKDVFLSKLSCGGFVLTADGKVKFLAPTPILATENGLPDSHAPQRIITGVMDALLSEAMARVAQPNDRPI